MVDLLVSLEEERVAASEEWVEGRMSELQPMHQMTAFWNTDYVTVQRPEGSKLVLGLVRFPSMMMVEQTVGLEELPKVAVEEEEPYFARECSPEV
jgi:hypothetical protein